MTRPFPLHRLRGEHVVCVTSFLHLSAFHFIYLPPPTTHPPTGFPPPPNCLHAMYFCDFLRGEFIEMRVLQPDGSASTSLPAPPLICSLPFLLSALFQTSLCLIHRGEDLGGSAKRGDSGPARRFCFIICLIRDLPKQLTSPKKTVCSGRPLENICAQKIDLFSFRKCFLFFFFLIKSKLIQIP